MSTETPLPRATMLLISYNQAHCLRQAIEGALAQDYPNLEIVVSDDCSTDASFAVIEATLRDYSGPHHLIVQRNDTNLGIGGNIDQAVRRSSGELIFITAGDDISLPQRVSRVVQFWLERNRQPELIAAHLIDMDPDGTTRDVIAIDDLAAWRSLDDWVRRPPHVIGAAQAWTRRLFDRFGGLPAGIVGEDMMMAFRAVADGRAVTLPEPLVKYRRGGLTNQQKALTAAAVIRGLTRKLASTQTELNRLLAEARDLGASAAVLAWLQQKINKEAFVEAMFAQRGWRESWHAWWRADDQPLAFRIRILTYAKAPWLLAPFFWLKRLRYRRSE